MVIPDAVRTTVLERIRQLDRAQRAIVMRASVIGRRFDVEILLATAACSEARVRAALERACALQLIVADQAGDGRYAFRHALTRDIVYAEFLAVRVKPLHRKIARMLERSLRTRGGVLEDLAYHSWAAGDAKRALRYNELAGDSAVALHAPAAAQAHYLRARSLIDVDSAPYSRLSEKLQALEDG